jgi:hypothetical protein
MPRYYNYRAVAWLSPRNRLSFAALSLCYSRVFTVQSPRYLRAIVAQSLRNCRTIAVQSPHSKYFIIATQLL